MMGKVRINVAGEDSTPVSNAFIDKYLADANDAQIKIYLYLLRMMGAGRSTSVSDLADRFNHTEKDVIRALSYWEKLGLLDLEYDSMGRLIGIHIEDVEPQPVVTPSVPIPQNIPVETGITPENVRPSGGGRIVRMPRPKNRNASEPLLFIAEQYFGRPLNTNEASTILYIKDTLHFSEDLIDYLMQHCAECGVRDFRYLETVALSWADKGITTVEQARNEAMRHDHDVMEILKSLGHESATDKELSYVNMWRTEYGFSQEIILEACGRTVLTTTKGRILYCDGILKSWKKNNVRTLDDIKRLDEEHASMSKSSKSSANRSNNRFNRFEQGDYDMPDLERRMVEN